MPSRMAKLRHELLTDLEQQTTHFLLQFGIQEDVSQQVAINLVNHLTNHWGGQLINIPKNHLYKVATRDLEIYRGFNGKNHAELARRYNLSVRAIYDIVKRTHKILIEEEQGALF